ncbi:M48 family metallopeptidase [Flavisphingomonas formosensis]|uniref:M48 family metallopeptidase n=1 Tax=Flavisphingomonas formosensis TaxID=861534 RepID=UPI0012FBAC2F|nr:M48 family metallopeptidase [Sphingomonas formosensis]
MRAADTLTAWHYDGQSAIRHQLDVRREGDTLDLGNGDRVAFADLRAAGERDAPLYARAGHDGWQIGFFDPPPEDWAALLPRQERFGGILDRIGVIPAVLGALLLSALGVYLLAHAAGAAARAVPERWEVAFGKAITGDDFGGKACTGVAGQRALDQLAARLTTDRRPVQVRVIDKPIVNAVTLPGRQILLFSGLIDAADTPEEVAGVLGHEIGHVEHRDAMSGLLRDFGLSLIVGSGDAGAFAQSLLSSRYSREAEQAADQAAMDSLARADISPAAMVKLFDRLSEVEKRFPGISRAFSYMSTHPLNADRRAMFQGAVRRDHFYQSGLDDAQWVAVKTMCMAR